MTGGGLKVQKVVTRCGCVADEILTGVDYTSVSDKARRKGEDARWFVGWRGSVADDLYAETLNAHDGNLVGILAGQLHALDHAVEG